MANNKLSRRQISLSHDNFVDEIVELLMELTDAPIEFIEAGAYFIISSTLGGMFRLYPSVKGVRRPNYWAILSSIPGAYRRSTVINICREIVKRTWIKYLKKKLGITEDEAEKIVVNLFLEQGTFEGIIDHIETTEGNEFMIMSHEFGRILEQITSRGKGAHYSGGADVLFSELYYGEEAIQDLSARGGGKQRRYLRPGIYATCLASMQELWLYARPIHIQQGLLRRFHLIYVDESDRWLPPIREINEEEVIDYIADTLASFRCKWEEQLEKNERLNDVIIVMPDEVKERLNSIDKEAHMRACSNPTLLNIYLQNEMEIVGRLAMLRCIGRAIAAFAPVVQDEEVKLPTHLVLIPEDVEKAREFYRRTVEPLKDAFARLPLSFNPRSVGEELRGYVLGIIREYGPITKSELARRSRLPSWLLDAVVEELIRSGDIRMEKVVKGKGRPVILYKIA